VLHPIADTEEYKLAGTCHIRGVMDGQLVDETGEETENDCGCCF
jgi:hypothetical protein